MGISNLSRLVEFFILVVVLLNKRRDSEADQLELSDLLTDVNLELDRLRSKKEPALPLPRKLALQSCLIGCGPYHTALVRNGDLYVWGITNSGRLGHGDLVADNCVSPPSRVETLHMLQIKVLSVACGGEHTMVITQQGVYGWGNSQYGQVGVGTRHHYTRPMLIETLSAHEVVSIECGQYHSLALTQDSNVYSWGWGVHGQLGHGDPEDQLTPTLVQAMRNNDVVKIAAGYCHSLMLTDDGIVYSCGCGYFGQLGHGDNQKKSRPTRLASLTEPVIAIATKYFHSVVVTVTNRVYSWGCHPQSLRYSAQIMRRARQLGQHLTDPVESYLKPNVVDTAYVNGKITQVVCGSLHTILVTSEGEVYVWGRNMDGQLGIGSKMDERIPKMLTKINDQHIVTVRSGGEFNIAMDMENTVWVWGKNDTGQLGYFVIELQNQIALHQRTQHRRSTTSSGSDFIAPTILKGLPVQDTGTMSPWQQSLMASSESGDSEYWITDDRVEDHLLAMLPPLDKMGKVKYCRKVIPAVLKYLPHLSQPSTALRQCVDNGDWQTAADIHLLALAHGQALLCQLQLLSDKRAVLSPESFRHYSIQIIQHHIRSSVTGDNSPTEIREELRVIILEVFEYWERQGLSIKDLEMIFLNQLSSVAVPLSLVIFRQPNMNNDTTADQVNKTLGPSAKFLQRFSTDFCLKLLHKVLSSSAKDRSILCKDWMSLIEQDPESNTSEQPKKTKPALELQPSQRLIPYDRLWQDIVQNLQKHSDSRSYIALTRNEMDHLEVQVEEQTDRKDTQTNDLEEQGPDGDKAAVVFTCGHHFTKRTFTEEVLSNFNRELTEGPNKLPYSASVLKQYYSREGLLPLACPKCVLNALMTIS